MQMKRDVDQSIAQRLQQMHATAQDLAKPVERRLPLELCGVDHRHLQRVLVHGRGLAVQQQPIPAAESLHAAPRYAGLG